MTLNEAPGPGFDEVLARRAMCRDFLADEVPAELLKSVLSAAFRGPSAGNTVGLELLVLESSDVQRYWDVTLPTDRREQFPWPGLLNAPVLVIPVVSPAAYVSRYGEPDKVASGLGEGNSAWTVPYWFVDGGAAVMALLLSAESVGLGALLFGQFRHESAVAETFGIPPEKRALGTIALGFAATGGRAPSASARRGRPNPGDLIHRSRW
ncbi:MAG TPA: nitroreductase family protein [Microthrixaceae bacterium]|nr:nitroreductase family protein [Microthrixaceae bacterium]